MGKKGFGLAAIFVLFLSVILITFQNCAPSAGKGGLSFGESPSTGGGSPGTTTGAFTVTLNPAVVTVVANNNQNFSATILGGTAPYSYTWTSSAMTVDCSRSNSSCDVKFTSIGYFSFTVLVTDSLGRVATANSSVSVTDGSPPPCTVTSMGNIESVTFDSGCGMTVTGWAWSDLGQNTKVYLSTSNVAPGFSGDCEVTVSFPRPDIKTLNPCITGNSGFSCKINNIQFATGTTAVVRGKTSTAADAPYVDVSLGIPSRCIAR